METESQLSQDLFERSKKVAPGGVHSPVRSFKGLGRPPVFFEQASGSHLISVEGKSYIDYCMSFGPLILGHRDPEVQETVEQMIKTAWSFGACERYSLELAEMITQEIPFVEKLRFVSSGTEAVMSSLRVARAATGRHKILKFEGCYHGHVDSLLVKSGSGLAGEGTSTSAGVSENVAKETLVVPLDNDQALEEIFSQWGSQIAAVILEPLP
ncbi:MAG: aminotransferase class III-fold pyridoxal phosphate-dependent enzyme, partial [Bdellovibrionales bacterium]